MNRFPFIIIIVPIVLFIPLVLKIIYVEEYIFIHADANLLGGIQVFTNDSIIYAVIFGLIYLSLISKVHSVISILLRIAALIIFAFYFIDFIIIVNYNTHLVLNDILKYSNYTIKYLMQIFRGSKLLLLIISLTVVIIFLHFVNTKYKIQKRPIHFYFIILLLVFLISGLFTKNDTYIHSWMYQNFINYNLIISSESRVYSDQFKKAFSYTEKIDSISVVPEKLNIIVLMVESLSSYQSNYFSGIRDWLPNLDSIAINNISFTNFYSNGFTTEDCLIAILTGKLPIYIPSSYSNNGGTSFNGFYNLKNSLPNILNHKGYTTEFLTAGDLEFSNLNKWAQSIGFNHIEGDENPFYKNWNRYSFNAAPDEALYDRVIQRINFNKDQNYFFYVSTLSTHHPYINPENNHRSEYETFKYADAQIGAFYQKLTDIGFFKNGILIIVGDHHAMIPIKKEEIIKFGSYKAAAKIPMIVSYGNKIKSVVSDQFQQIDIYNSIVGLTSTNQLYSDWLGCFLEKEKRYPKYIAFRRGDYRNLISVFSGKKEFLVKVDGDDTRVINNSNIDSATKKLILNKINSSRIINNSTENSHHISSINN